MAICVEISWFQKPTFLVSVSVNMCKICQRCQIERKNVVNDCCNIGRMILLHY